MRRYDEKSRLIYVSPGSVRYNREDIELLLPWLAQMREGSGPHETESGYIGGSKTGTSPRAGYEAWCQVAAEIDRRLQRTGDDLYLVNDLYCHGLSVEDIAIKIFTPTREIQRRLNSAVSYIASGPCPRWLTCLDCRQYRTCHKKIKGRLGVTYREWTSHHRYKNIAKR